MNYSRGFRTRQMAERKLAERKLNFQGEGLSGVLTWLLTAVGRTEVILVEIKSAGWKLAIAAELKRRSTVTNRWLAETMQMGNLHEVSRKVAAWQRKPDQRMQSLLVKTPRTDSVGFLPGRGKKTSRIRSP